MMDGVQWMLYGANGYTGRVILAEALRLGHKPTVAGRSDAVRVLGEQYGVPWRIFDLEDAGAVRTALAGHALVLNVAAPFARTAVPLARAAIAAGVHYADVSAEATVAAALHVLDHHARNAGAAVVPTLAFSTIATDSLAVFLVNRLPDATTLEIATALPASGGGQGQAATSRDIILAGGQVRRNGRIERRRFGSGGKRVRFLNGTQSVVPVALPNLETAYWATGIPSITVSLALSAPTAAVVRMAGPVVQWLTAHRSPPIREQVTATPTVDESATCEVWARVTNVGGETAEAWLETGDGYAFTAEAAVRGVDRILATRPVGVLAPVQVLGPDFPLEITGVRRVGA